MAARVAEELEQENNVRIERVGGGLGEFRVTLDGEELYSSGRLGYPSTRRVLERLRGRLPG